MAIALVGLGSNVGDRAANLARALELLGGNREVTAITASKWLENLPIGGPSGQGSFLNAAARIETSLSPQKLLVVLHQIEAHLGRTREVRWDRRTLDLDLLLYDELILTTPELQIPHPSMAFRRFVLEPAAEVAAPMLHPVLNRSVGSLWEHLKHAAPYAAIMGEPAAATALCLQLAEQVGASHVICDDIADSAEPNRTSLASDRWLEFLGRRSKLFATIASIDRTRWTISDFWLGEICLALSDDVDATNRSAIGYAWWKAEQVTAPAKLVIMIDPERQFDPPTVAVRWRQLTSNPLMPFLLLRSSNPDVQLAESIAALESMQ